MPSMESLPPDSFMYQYITRHAVWNPEAQEWVGPGLSKEAYLILNMRGMKVWANLLATVTQKKQLTGMVSRMARNVAYRSYLYTRKITHVETGSLRASHRVDAEDIPDGGEANVHIDPTAINPKRGTKPSEYGLVEHARGGTHAFYEKTFQEHAPRAVELEAQAMRRGLADAMKQGRNILDVFNEVK